MNVGHIVCTEKRGKYQNRPNRLDQAVWSMIEEHWKLIPHKTSHYAQKKTNKKYFKDPTLTLKKVFSSFQEYYSEKTSTPLKMDYSTYAKYFNTNSSYAFIVPKTDVCDYCTECEKLLATNPEHTCKEEYLKHKDRVDQYKKFKKNILIVSTMRTMILLLSNSITGKICRFLS